MRAGRDVDLVRWACVTMVLLLVVTACSSTATAPVDRATDQSATTDGPQLETAPTGSRETGEAAAPQPADGSSPVAERSSSARDANTLDPSVTSGSTPACPHVAAGTPGVTDEEILVGAVRFQNLNAALTPGVEPAEADLDEYYEAMVGHVNANGGIACRRVELVWYDQDALDRSFVASMEQRMCATWTQDHRVFAAIPLGFNGPYDILYPCLDRAGVAIIDTRGITMRDAEDFAEVPRLLAVNGVRLDRGTAAQVHALVRQGFLGAENRIGVVHYDAPRFDRTIERALIPALAAHGLSLTERRAVAVPTSSGDNPDRDRDAASVALRFKIADIDRVLFVRGPNLAAGFMNSAAANDYQPHYGLTSDDHPLHAANPPSGDQLRGARGIGWLPDMDLYPRRPDLWPARRACLEFFAQRGLRAETTLDQILALQVCEAVGFLEAAVDTAPHPLSANAVVTGASRLGTGYESPSVRETRFGPGHRDGPATYRDLAYDEACGCLTYLDAPRSFG